MNLIYNSEQYSVVEFGPDRDLESLRFGGYEIVDKGGVAEDVAWVSARSRHSGGVNCVYADGSVHFISDTINVDVWRALGSTQGGETTVTP
ncbi:MAG: DUF3567 family protein [Thermoguttaceae bacterium]